MKFRFPYEKLLEHRKRLQEEASKVLAVAERALADEKDKLNKLYDGSSQALQFRFEGERSRAHPDLLKSVDTFTKGQVIRIEAQRKVVRQHQQTVEEKRETLREAAVSFKIIERLREKKKEGFDEEFKKREAKELDEIVLMRASWRKS